MPVTKCPSFCCSTALAFALCVWGCDRSPSTPSPLRTASTPGPGPSSTTSPTTETATGRASGTVVDTRGRPLAGATITSIPPSSGVDTQTDTAGAFTFSYVLGRALNVRVSAAEYEPLNLTWSTSRPEVTLRLVMQLALLVAVGQQRDVALTNDDLPYYVGEAYESDYCRPCKLIRIDGMSGTARARVTLRWTGDDFIQMWASNGYDARKARVENDQMQVVDVGNLDWIYVGLPLGADRKPQQLTREMTFRISVE